MAEGESNSAANPIVFFDITLGGEPLGRIKFELFSQTTPLTAQNFLAFCTGSTKSAVTNRPQGYKNSRFHRIIKSFMIQGGDFLNADGTGSICIFNQARNFPDENFTLTHDKAGLLSMANSGPNTNGCQFFITTAPAPFLNGKHVVFGRVVEGMDVVGMIENTRVRPGGEGRPVNDVVIAQCGEM